MSKQRIFIAVGVAITAFLTSLVALFFFVRPILLLKLARLNINDVLSVHLPEDATIEGQKICGSGDAVYDIYCVESARPLNEGVRGKWARADQVGLDAPESVAFLKAMGDGALIGRSDLATYTEYSQGRKVVGRVTPVSETRAYIVIPRPVRATASASGR